MKLYGSLNNRIEENNNFLNRDIMPGDDITMYYWSDRTCYFVTKVVNQKHLFIHEYNVVADHSKPGGMGHQDWLYFKTNKEEQVYVNDCVAKGWLPKECYHDLADIKENQDIEIVYRYNKWWQKINGKYHKLQPISFGVKDYYYDWSF